MMEKSKGNVAVKKFFFLFLIVFFLLVTAGMAHSQSVRLLPNGGKNWVIGQEKNISWTSSGLNLDVKRVDIIASKGSIRRLETKPEKLEIKPRSSLPDFKIKDVIYDYHHQKLNICFDGGLGKYSGPIAFDVYVTWGRMTYLNLHNWTYGDNRTEFVALDLEWPEFSPPYLNVRVTINSNRQINELNYNNNIYEGKIFENRIDFKILGCCNRVGRRAIFWPSYDDCFNCFTDGMETIWDEVIVKNEIQKGELWYYDPYDPNCNTLIGTATVKVGSYSRKGGTAHITFTYDSYDGRRTVERQITLNPGELGFVETGIMLNLQRENFIEARISSPSCPGERVRFEINFQGLPYDLD